MRNRIPRTIFPKDLTALLIISILVAVFYGNTLRNGFIHDDHGQVVDNTYIHSLMYLPKVFTSCIWESAVGNCKETYYWRPLQSLSYMITYQFSSEPWIFHLANLVYYAIAVWLTYILLLTLTGNLPLAVFTAGIFLIHPLNTEVVNWVAAVPELLYTIFILLSTINFILYRRTGDSTYLWRLLLTFALGVLAKEPAVFLPFVFLTLDVTFFKKTITDFFRWKYVEPYIYAVGIFAVYMAARIHVLGGLGADPYLTLTVFQRIYTFISLFGSYVWKLVYPYPLNLFYTFHTTYNIYSPSFIASAVFLISFLFILYLSIRKKWHLIALALVWYLAFLTPSLIFISSIGENLFAERHVFASTIGFALLTALGLGRLEKLGRLGNVSRWAIVAALVIPSFFVIQARNGLWHDDETIYTDTLTKSPDADLIRYNLAHLYEQNGDVSRARDEYDLIVKRNSWRGLDKVFNNLGNIVRKEGDIPLATQYFQQSIAVNPLHVESYNNLGAMAFEKGDMLTSLLYLCRANQINPMFTDANNNLDHVVNTIQAMDEKSYSALFREMVSGAVFQKADAGKEIAFKEKDCSTTGCLIRFSNRLPATTPIFPFLIGAEVRGEVVRPTRYGIHQATGDIVLDIDKKLENTDIDFLFPTCDGTYIQVSVRE